MFGASVAGSFSPNSVDIGTLTVGLVPMRERWRILPPVAGSTTPCLFCGRTGRKLTKEDVIPRWLWRVFREGRGMQGPVTMSVDGKPFRVAANTAVRYGGICADCNHGWMHDLENAARPIMVPAVTGDALRPGHELRLDAGAQTVLATWAVKTWLLLELAVRYVTKAGVEAPAALRYLYQHRQPPTSVFVMVATAHLDASVAMEFHTTRLTFKRTGQHGVLSLMTFGRLGLSLTMPELDGIVTLPTGEPELELAFPQIWPHQVSEVRWPTARVVTQFWVDRLYPVGGIEFP